MIIAVGQAVGRSSRAPVDNVIGGGDHGWMKERIEKLENCLAAIALELRIIRSTCVTKSDIAELKSALNEAKTTIILWVVMAVVFAQLLPSLLKQFGLL